MHVRTPYPDLENGWTDCAATWGVVGGSLAMHFTQDGDVRTSARVTVHTFKHVCLLPLGHRPKGVLLVLTALKISAQNTIVLWW